MSDDGDAFAKAETYFANKEYEKAEPYFETYYAANPADLKTIEYLGDIAAHKEDFDESLKYYKLLVDAVPKNANYHYKYGGVLGLKAFTVNRLKALTMLGDIKEHLGAAAALDAKHIDARWALIEFYIQIPRIVGGSEKKAQEYANQLLAISRVDGYLANGYVAEYSDRDEDAKRYFLQAVKVSEGVACYAPDMAHNDAEGVIALNDILAEHQKDITANRLHYQLGKVSAQYNLKLDEGITCLSHYISNHSRADGVPKRWAYLRLAQIYRQKGNKEAALKWVRLALKDKPNFDDALEEEERIELL